MMESINKECDIHPIRTMLLIAGVQALAIAYAAFFLKMDIDSLGWKVLFILSLPLVYPMCRALESVERKLLGKKTE